MKKSVTILLVAVTNILYGQSPYKQYTIGNKLPPVKMGSIINSNLKIPSSSSLKGKLVILDFMSPYCPGCIQKLPEMEALQKRFAGKVQFIVVMAEKAAIVKKFLAKYKLANQFTVPVIVEDTRLNTCFKHQTISHIVWLNGNSIVKAITYAEYINEKNIQTLLDGKQVDWPVKQEIENYEVDTPLLPVVSHAKGTVYYTAFTPYRQGIAKDNKMIADSLHGQLRWYVLNLSIINLYRRTLKYFPQILMAENRIIYEVKDLTKIIYDTASGYWHEFDTKQTWCYEAVLPLATGEERLLAKMQADLNLYTPYKGSIEARLADCWVLENLISNGNKADSLNALDRQTNPVRWLADQEAAVGEWVIDFNNVPGSLPMVDLTTYDRNKKPLISERAFTDTTALKNELLQNGFKLTRSKKELQFFVLRDAYIK